MKRQSKVCLSAAILAGLTTFFGWKAVARAAYETAEYRVIESDGPFEIREYPVLTMATTDMESADRSDDGSFMRLFRYISGANEAKQKVAMTTPVFMKSDAGDSSGQMGFVVPKEVAAAGAPVPTGDQVRLSERAGGRYAVIRFAGRLTSDSRTKAEAKLKAWIAERNLQSDGITESAGYDPPWTPGPFRRNEVLLRLID